MALLLCGSLLLIGVQATGVGTLGVLATDMEDLPASVQDYEPHLALFG